ncbi:MAG: hypothetical protein ACFFCC_19085 [Promethearchaeota archaeon]
MERKEKNSIIGGISLIIGVIILLCMIPSSIVVFYSVAAFLSAYIYLWLDGLVLGIFMILYAIFMIRPAKTISRKQNLGLAAMIFGLILIILPIVGIGIQIYSYSILYGFSYVSIVVSIPFLIITIPGIAVLVHGRFLLKRSRPE